MSYNKMKSETSYQIVYNKLWQNLKKRAPEEIVAARAVTYNKSTCQFIVVFFNEEYIVDCANEIIWSKLDRHNPDVVATIIILNYLAFAQPARKSSPKWVSIKEISGGMMFYPAFYKSALLALIDTFGYRSSRLFEVGRSLGGKPGAIGDASVIFESFPEIPLYVVIWEGDEEVRANATILYDPSIEIMLESAIIIDLGIYLAGQLKELAGQK